MQFLVLLLSLGGLVQAFQEHSLIKLDYKPVHQNYCQDRVKDNYKNSKMKVHSCAFGIGSLCGKGIPSNNNIYEVSDSFTVQMGQTNNNIKCTKPLHDNGRLLKGLPRNNNINKLPYSVIDENTGNNANLVFLYTNSDKKRRTASTMGIPRPENTEAEDELFSSQSARFSADPCSYSASDNPIYINRKGKRVSEIQCEYNMWRYKYEVLEADRNTQECLNRISDDAGYTISYVIGGVKAGDSDFPHMGAIGWRKIGAVNDYKFMCGSSLISTRFAITAAHCSGITHSMIWSKELASTNPDIVRFGSVIIENDKDINSYIIYDDEKIDGPLITLKKYRFNTKHNDVALIKFVREVQIQKNVRPACIWNGYLRGHTEGNVTGWGKTQRLSESYSPHLLYATLDFIDGALCDTVLYEHVTYSGIKQHQFCAGKLSGGSDTCQGDSGGPIQIQLPMPSSIDKDGTMHHIVGVTSFGKGCGLPNYPGVYVNISDPNILCWIERTVWPEEMNRFCGRELFEGY